MIKEVAVFLIISMLIIPGLASPFSRMISIKDWAQQAPKPNSASRAVARQDTQSHSTNAGLKHPLDSINNKYSTSSDSSFTDNFETDSSLNTNFWSANSTSLVNLTEQMSCPAATFIQPTLSFNSSGMEMSGPDSYYTGTGIQTVNTYQSPFYLEVAAEGISGPATAFGIAITNPQLTSYFIVWFELNPSNGPYYGIWVTDPAISAICNLGEQIYGSPSFNTVYTVYLNVSSNNTVTVTIDTIGGVISETFSGIGSGPFYITLFQRIGLPYAPLSEEVALFKYFSLVLGAPPTGTGKLGISVVDGDSNLPIQNAVVNIAASTTGQIPSPEMTNSFGSVVFTNLAPGNYSVYVTASGYSLSSPQSFQVYSNQTTKGTIAMIPSPDAIPFTVSAGVGGTITVISSAINGGNPETVPSGTTTSWDIPYGTIVQMAANPSPGYTFGTWSTWSASSGITGSGGSPVNTSSPNITIQVYTENDIIASFNTKVNSPPIMAPPIMAPTSNGVLLNIQASLLKESNGYAFTLQITPQGTSTWLLFTNQQISQIDANIMSQLAAAGISSTNATIFSTVAPNSVINQQAVDFLDAIIGFQNYLELVTSGVEYYENFGAVTAIFLSSSQIVADESILSSLSPPSIVVSVVNSMYNGISNTLEINLLGKFPIYVGGTSTQISPSYIVGPGQELEIIVTGLSVPSAGTIHLQISGTNYALNVPAPGVESKGTLQDTSSGQTVYEVSTGSFSIPLKLSRGCSGFFSCLSTLGGLFSSNYYVSIRSVEDPVTQFINFTTYNVQFVNMSFNSSTSVLSAYASLINSSATANGSVEVFIPSSLLQNSYPTFYVSLNGTYISYSILNTSNFGYTLYFTINGNGTFLLGIPKLPPLISLSYNYGILTVAGSGFAPNSSILLQYTLTNSGANFTNFIDLTNGSLLTSANGYFVYQNATLHISSGEIIIVRAMDDLGNIAISSLTVIEIPSFNVTFTESGLPAGTSWSVTLNGTTETSTTDTITFMEPNGVYSYSVGPVAGYVATPPSGSVTVNYANTTVDISFTQLKYAVTFIESGLPPGTAWSVTLNGTTETSTTDTITFMEPGGTYSFSVGSVGGYTASPPSGTITVSGANVSQAVTFSAVSSTTSTSTPTSTTSTSTPTSTTSTSTPTSTTSTSTATPTSTTSTSTTTPTSTTSTSHTELYAIVGVIIAVIIIGIAVSLFRRKG